MKENISQSVKNGLIGGGLSAFASAFLNYFFLPFPQGIADNVIGHGVGGFFCGFISAAIAVLMVLQHRRRVQPSESMKGGAGYDINR